MKRGIKHHQTKIYLLLFLAVATAVFSLDEPRVPGKFREAAEQVRSYVREFQEVSRVPGLSVAVAVEGKVVWSEGFGFADLEQRVPVQTTTRFRLGSVSKVLTAAAVAKLHQDGKLDLDAPIRKYVPGFPDKGEVITSRQLAGHLGGIRHYLPKDFTPSIDFTHYGSVTESLKIFQDDPLVAPPGSKYQYSTFGYTLLSQVVESSSGKPFLDYLEQEVFGPLGMKHTGADKREEVIPNRSRFYERRTGGKIIHASYVDASYKWAGGGLLSTAHDLAVFGSAHLQPGYFTKEALDVLFTSQKTTDGKETGVGLAWRIGADAEKRAVWHHAGSIDGGRSVLIIYPDAKIVVSLLSNLGQTPPAVEQTALLVAAPFLNAINRDKNGNFKSHLSDYTYSVSANEKSTNGRIEWNRNSRTGWITTPQPLRTFLERTGLPETDKQKLLPLFSNKESAHYVVVTPAGLLPLAVHSTDETPYAKIECPLGPKPLEMNLTLQPTATTLND